MTSNYSPKREMPKSEAVEKGESIVSGSVKGEPKRNLSGYPSMTCPHCGKEIKK